MVLGETLYAKSDKMCVKPDKRDGVFGSGVYLYTENCVGDCVGDCGNSNCIGAYVIKDNGENVLDLCVDNKLKWLAVILKKYIIENKSAGEVTGRIRNFCGIVDVRDYDVVIGWEPTSEDYSVIEKIVERGKVESELVDKIDCFDRKIIVCIKNDDIEIDSEGFILGINSDNCDCRLGDTDWGDCKNEYEVEVYNTLTLGYTVEHIKVFADDVEEVARTLSDKYGIQLKIDEQLDDITWRIRIKESGGVKENKFTCIVTLREEY